MPRKIFDQIKTHGGTAIAFLALAVYTILVITCIIFVSSMLLLGLIVVVPPIIAALAKKNKNLTFKRIRAACWGLGFLVLLFFPAFWLIPDQVYRRVNRMATLVTPQDPAVITFTDDFLAMHPTFESMTFEDRMKNATAFMLERIEWRSDFDTYGLLGHVATPAECIALGADDCQGQAVVLASMLLQLNVSAWAVETPFHWYVLARDPALPPMAAGWEKNVETYQDSGEVMPLNRDGGGLMQSWRWEPVILIFNDRETLFPVDFWQGAWISWTSTGFFYDAIFPVFRGPGIIGVLGAMYLLAIPVSAWLIYMSGEEPDWTRAARRKTAKVFFLKVLVLGTCLFGVMIAWYFLQPVIWDYTLVLAISMISTICTIIAEPWFWKKIKVA
nr:hypothetical protein [Candidatus Sigynarchaeota archaeon]